MVTRSLVGPRPRSLLYPQSPQPVVTPAPLVPASQVRQPCLYSTDYHAQSPLRPNWLDIDCITSTKPDPLPPSSEPLHVIWLGTGSRPEEPPQIVRVTSATLKPPQIIDSGSAASASSSGANVDTPRLGTTARDQVSSGVEARAECPSSARDPRFRGPGSASCQLVLPPYTTTIHPSSTPSAALLDTPNTTPPTAYAGTTPCRANAARVSPGCRNGAEGTGTPQAGSSHDNRANCRPAARYPHLLPLFPPSKRRAGSFPTPVSSRTAHAPLSADMEPEGTCATDPHAGQQLTRQPRELSTCHPPPPLPPLFPSRRVVAHADKQPYCSRAACWSPAEHTAYRSAAHARASRASRLAFVDVLNAFDRLPGTLPSHATTPLN
ncbi:unnamed protein product [Rhizoctonia solani]|uniref:Uncharacterized protein n=1 Tax=Rhizoctonia solani TaxID=456999 RepID=A0A8H2Y5J6_9AGAM|nr:unnamed protein product [Rhizoctonia solani]